MIVLAIDPGPQESAWVRYDSEAQRLLEFGKTENRCLAVIVKGDRRNDHLAIEMIASYGMPVGREVFETALWVGRFVQAWDGELDHTLVYRRDVKLHLCNSPRANDATVRQALLDRWGGGSRALGNKRAPGPLYGVSGDVWQALAVAVTWSDLNEKARAA